MQTKTHHISLVLLLQFDGFQIDISKLLSGCDELRFQWEIVLRQTSIAYQQTVFALWQVLYLSVNTLIIISRYRWSWNCCNRWTCFVVIWKHFCFVLSMGTKIRIDSVMQPRSSSRGRNTSASVTVTVINNGNKAVDTCEIKKVLQ